ncbi:MAG: hypothetical protein ND807_00800, partial [Vicinamibacterales bacterium]|nr:hypothetical protein [Vicinamibacterales bacterium]
VSDAKPVVQKDDDAYVIAETADVEIPENCQAIGTYDMELPARCPFCRSPIRTLKVIRMVRSKVAFTSTLPRSGRAVVCPACECIISAEVSGVF